MTATAAADRTRSHPAGNPPPWHRWVLATDAAGCLAIGATLLVAPGWLADGFTLATIGAVRAAGAAFVVAALVNAIAATRGGRAALRAAIGIDAAALVGAVALAVADGGEPWARLLLVAVALVCAAFGTLKVVGARR